MTFDASIDDPVLWHEGMLLTPQHFQQHDLRIHRLLRHQMEQLDPYYWGLLKLKYSAARLDEGLLQIDELHAVMPDGLAIVRGLGAQDMDMGAERLSLDLTTDPALKATGRVRIHLVVPMHVDGAASDRASVRRYDSFEGPVSVDDNTGDDPLAVLRLRPRVSLFAGASAPEAAVSMPLMEVRKEVGGQLVVTGYHPPLIQMGASEFLGRRALQGHLEQLVEKVRRKASRLAAMKGNRSQNLFALTAGLPELEVLVHSKRARPFEMYRALAKLVGSASALHPEGMPPMLEPYRHGDMLKGFAAAIRYVDELLRSLELEFELRAFEQKEPDTFSLFVEPTWATDELVVELEAAAGQDAAHVDAWLADARVGSAEHHDWLAHQRSPGAWSERLGAPAVARYTQRAGVNMFVLRNRSLSGQGDGQLVITAGQALLLQGGGRIAPPERIVLYRHRSESGQSGPGR